MEQVRNALRSLTQEVCRQLEGQEIPKRPVWTVVSPPEAAPYVARDFDRPALSDLRLNLTIGLFKMPEYKAAAEFIEKDAELSQGILVDALGSLIKPEANNITRALVTNFLWRYLREGKQLDWDEERFAETINELEGALDKKTVTFYTIMPLSNLKMEVTSVDFGEDLKLRPASLEELEAWINRDRSLVPLTFGGPPEWNSRHLDKPGVLQATEVVVGRPRPADLQDAIARLSQLNAGNVITALRLVLNAPIRIIFQESQTEGLMALGGGGTSWSWDTPPRLLRPSRILIRKRPPKPYMFGRFSNQVPISTF